MPLPWQQRGQSMHVPGGDQLLEASIYEPSQQPTTSASIKVYAYGRGGQEWGGGGEGSEGGCGWEVKLVMSRLGYYEYSHRLH